jgi:hypothetical protein
LISLPMSLLANGVISAAGAAITVIGIAAYGLLSDRRNEMADVFA